MTAPPVMRTITRGTATMPATLVLPARTTGGKTPRPSQAGR